MHVGVLVAAALILLAPVRLYADPSTSSATSARPTATVGAIRWDAWSGCTVTAEVERALSPQRYHHRLPWFAEVLSDTAVRIRGDSQAIMDREIAWAADAGIGYWAFVLYDDAIGMSKALDRYLSSQHKQRVQFCMLLHSQIGCPAQQWPAVLKRYETLLREPSYQTVLDNRPLIYMFRPGLESREAEIAQRIQDLHQAADRAGRADPYLVYMGWNPAKDRKVAQSLGFDALSAYAFGGHGTFANLTEQVRKVYWDASVQVGAELVPMATTGWDKRPRMDHPVSWERDHDYHRTRTYVELPTPQQIADHLGDALDFVRINPAATPANTVIVYAWNEYDEGGWLAPTRAHDGTPETSRLDAIAQCLLPKAARETSAPFP